MRTVSSDATAVVSPETQLDFNQVGDLFSAHYRGGIVVAGYLLGHLREDGSLDFRYVQADSDGNLDAGHSTGFLSRLADGRLRLTEDFQWTTRAASGRNVFEQVSIKRGKDR
jgi:hypothetical protein